MIELTNGFIREAIRRQGGPAPAPNRLHLLGIRSAQRLGPTSITRQVARPNEYDDCIVTFGAHLEAFRATVDPGATFTLAPLRPDGCAHLADTDASGPYRYAVGLHRKMAALIQAGSVRLWRDRDRDGRQDVSELIHRESGNGIDVHRMGNSPHVDDWSAGCQGIPLAAWPEFWAIVDAAHRSGQREFAYWLIDGSHLI